MTMSEQHVSNLVCNKEYLSRLKHRVVQMRDHFKGQKTAGSLRLDKTCSIFFFLSGLANVKLYNPLHRVIFGLPCLRLVSFDFFIINFYFNNFTANLKLPDRQLLTHFQLSLLEEENCESELGVNQG